MKKLFLENNNLIFLEDGVREPSPETLFLFEQVNKRHSGGSVVVVGTGAGLLPILLSPIFSKVIGLEINSSAVDLSRRNAIANGTKNVEIRESDLFSALNEKVDAIIANPPQMPSPGIDKDHWHSVANDGGTGGRELIDKIINDAPRHLHDGGKLFLSHLEFVNFDETIKKMSQSKMKVKRLDTLTKPFSEFSRTRSGIQDRDTYEVTVFEGVLKA